MKTILVLLRPAAVGLLLALVPAAGARELPFDLFKNSGLVLSPKDREDVTLFLESLDLAPPPPADLESRARWWMTFASTVPRAAMRLEPRQYDGRLAAYLHAVGLTGPWQVGDLLLAKITREITELKTSGQDPQNILLDFLEAALTLPQTSRSWVLVSDLLGHVLAEESLSSVGLAVLESHLEVLDGCPNIREAILNLAVARPTTSRIVSNAGAAALILARRPELIRANQIGPLINARRKAKHVPQNLRDRMTLDAALERVIDAADHYLAMTSGESEILFGAFRAPSPTLNENELADIARFLRFVSVSANPKFGLLRRAEWWHAVAQKTPRAAIRLKRSGTGALLEPLFGPRAIYTAGRFGDVLVRQIFADVNLAAPRSHDRQVFVEILLRAALEVPRDAGILRELSAGFARVFRDGYLRVPALLALADFSNVLRESPELLDLVAHYASSVPRNARSPGVNLQAIKVLTRQTALLNQRHLDGIIEASRRLETMPWSSDHIDEIQTTFRWFLRELHDQNCGLILITGDDVPLRPRGRPRRRI